MRVRHRIPSLFSLSMIDVLCCALGCVILLWLLNLREAKEHEDNTSELLQAARANYDQASTLLATASADRDSAYGLVLDMYGRIEKLENEKAAIQKQFAAQRAAAEDLDRKLRASAARLATLDADVRAGVKQYET